MLNRNILLGSGVLAVVLILLSGLSIYAAGQNTGDYGRSISFIPLVRHMISQLHCYDTGTDDCETTSHLGTKFTKEHTMGFLLDGSSRKMGERGFKPLYLCEARNNSGVMMVTAGTTESDPAKACRTAGFRASRAGYISATNQIEAPWPIYRCKHSETNDTLLTDSPTECVAQSYGSAQLLGYLYAGGPQTLK